MNTNPKPEVWLRGPLPGIPPILQPVAHALLQATEELEDFASVFPARLLWEKPFGVASVGFHLQHLTGVLDRLFSYAQALQLNESQLAYLKQEGVQSETEVSYTALLNKFKTQVAASIEYLKTVDENTLSEVRLVGRAKIESTQIGLLFHAAEHTQRHMGQLLVTARVLLAQQ